MTELFRWDWAFGRADEIAARFAEHLWLTFVAVAVGLAISFPLALLGVRRRRLLGFITGFSGLLYTIPSLALFAFLIPFTGLSVLTAEIGLVSYTLLILVRNIATGLDGVPPEAREAARGMGLTPRQLLWKVEIPLAIPAVVAGLRIATVSTVGLVTVTALIGLGGLGHYILFGLQRNFPTAVLLGVTLSVALALALDVAFLKAQRMATPWAARSEART